MVRSTPDCTVDNPAHIWLTTLRTIRRTSGGLSAADIRWTFGKLLAYPTERQRFGNWTGLGSSGGNSSPDQVFLRWNSCKPRIDWISDWIHNPATNKDIKQDIECETWNCPGVGLPIATSSSLSALVTKKIHEGTSFVIMSKSAPFNF